MPMDEDNDDGLGGRGALRRAWAETHRYAERLVALDDTQLAAIDMPDEIRREVVVARGVPPSAARNRQLNYVDKLVRQLDEPDIEAIARFLDDPRAAHRQRDRAVSGWVERLLAEGDAAVTELVAERPDLEIQRLRQLVRNARGEHERGAPGRAHRALRKLLSGG